MTLMHAPRQVSSRAVTGQPPPSGRRGAAAPRTVRVRTRPTLHFTGLGVPELGRGEFIAAGVAGFAAFALLGLFSVSRFARGAR
jgi:hypothetical protein